MPQLFTTNMDYEQLLESQDRPDQTFNDAMRAIDILIFGESDGDTSEPSVPSTGFLKLVAGPLVQATGLGSFSGHRNALVYYDGSDWRFVPWSASHIWYGSNANFDSGLRYTPKFEMENTTVTEFFGVQAVTFAKDWGTLSATRDEFVCVCDTGHKMFIENVALVSDAASTSDGSNNWSFELYNVTKADGHSISTTDGSMGDFSADVAIKIIGASASDKINNGGFDIDDGDILELRVIKTGSPGDLTRFHVQATFTISQQ